MEIKTLDRKIRDRKMESNRYPLNKIRSFRCKTFRFHFSVSNFSVSALLLSLFSALKIFLPPFFCLSLTFFCHPRRLLPLSPFSWTLFQADRHRPRKV